MTEESNATWARETALAVPIEGHTALVMTGRDRVSWLNGLVTADVAKVADGVGLYTLIVGRTGRIMADAAVFADAERLIALVPTPAVEALRHHLDHHLVMEDVEISTESDVALWAIHGPRAAEILTVVRRAGAVGGTIDRTGLGGAVAVVSQASARVVHEPMNEALALAGGGSGVAAAGETLRLERAVPRFGVDFDEHVYPQEAGLEKGAVSFNKGCYLGQEVVCMLEMRGHVKRRLVSLVLDAEEPPSRGAPVTDAAGAPVGQTTSAGFSPTLRRAVAFAMVKRGAAELGGELHIDGVRAKVVDRPA